MNTLFIAVLLMSATGGLLVLCLFLLHPVTMKAFSSTWHYRMCMLVALFMLIPIGIVGGNLFANIQNTANQDILNVPAILNDIITVQQPVQQANILPQQAQPALSQADLSHVTPAESIKPSITVKNILPYLPLIWLVGFFVFIIWHCIELIRFKKKSSLRLQFSL